MFLTKRHFRNAFLFPAVFTLFIGYLLALEFLSGKNCFLPDIIYENTTICPDYASWVSDLRFYLIVFPAVGIETLTPISSVIAKVFSYLNIEINTSEYSGGTFWWIEGYIIIVLFLTAFGFFMDRKAVEDKGI